MSHPIKCYSIMTNFVSAISFIQVGGGATENWESDNIIKQFREWVKNEGCWNKSCIFFLKKLFNLTLNILYVAFVLHIFAFRLRVCKLLHSVFHDISHFRRKIFWNFEAWSFTDFIAIIRTQRMKPLRNDCIVVTELTHISAASKLTQFPGQVDDHVGVGGIYYLRVHCCAKWPFKIDQDCYSCKGLNMRWCLHLERCIVVFAHRPQEKVFIQVLLHSNAMVSPSLTNITSPGFK